MIDWRIYRAAFVPFAVALVFVAFSLGQPPQSLTTTLAPDAFDGGRAAQTLATLVARYPNRRPGGAGDRALANTVAAAMHAQGGHAASVFSVQTRSFSAQTIDGKRTLETVIAQRPGSVSSQIVVIAHRDAAGRGAAAELSGTAALLELAHVFSGRATRRTLTLVSTSGGSGGDAGVIDFAAHTGGPVDAVLVLGDLAGAHARGPFVVPWSDRLGSAPLRLQKTVAGALTQEVGSDGGQPSAATQFARLALPVTIGEQGPLLAHGLPAVLVQASGERGPNAGEPVDSTRLTNFGRGVLRAITALDSGPEIAAGPTTAVLAQRKLVPAWAVRWFVGGLMLPVLVGAVDGIARMHRRREPIAIWVRWVLAGAAPFALAAGFAIFLGWTGLTIAPPAPVAPAATPIDGGARAALASIALVFVLAWLLRPFALRRLRARGSPALADGAPAALLVVLCPLALIVWVLNPFAAALLVPALHLWLPAIEPSFALRRTRALALLALGLVPLALLLAVDFHQLGLGPLSAAWMAVLMLAGGHVSPLWALIWSLALGCTFAAFALVLGRAGGPGQPPPITVRGPATYAGPGSLGGTESALRR